MIDTRTRHFTKPLLVEQIAEMNGISTTQTYPL